jgi:uncharacterized protein
MIRTLVTVVFLAFALSRPVVAQDFLKGLEAHKRDDYATAIREWRLAAEQGDARAQYNLEFMYTKGQGVPKDYTEAATEALS